VTTWTVHFGEQVHHGTGYHEFFVHIEDEMGYPVDTFYGLDANALVAEVAERFGSELTGTGFGKVP